LLTTRATPSRYKWVCSARVNLLIIRLALLGVRRYNEWYEQLGIANSVR